jgi:DNA-binding response OmpR family regulator
MPALRKILIIEDDPIIGKIYQNKFRVEGFDVELANDGQKAIEHVKSSVPDLVLLDLQLPKVNGVEVLKFIRSHEPSSKVPVIVFSNSYLSSLVQAAWQAGANKVLTKADCTPRQLIDIIRTSFFSANGNQVSQPPAKPVAEIAVESKPEEIRKETVVIRKSTPPTQSEQAQAPGGTEADLNFQSQIRQQFVNSSGEIMGALRTRLLNLGKADGETRLPQIYELYRAVHSLTGNAGIAGFSRIAHLSNAFEALLKEMFEKPKTINASSLRTVAHAIDLIGLLLENAQNPSLEPTLPPSILVIDDQISSNWLVSSALEMANLRCVTIDEGRIALRLLEQNSFDLIFLDIDMPEINGFEICAQIRKMPTNLKTPVIFVTGLTDIESRGKSAMSGGTDLITKPFLPIELAVKALTHLIRVQVKKIP